MQLDVEVSPPAFVGAQLELECTYTVPEVYMQCMLNVEAVFALQCIYNLVEIPN